MKSPSLSASILEPAPLCFAKLAFAALLLASMSVPALAEPGSPPEDLTSSDIVARNIAIAAYNISVETHDAAGLWANDALDAVDALEQTMNDAHMDGYPGPYPYPNLNEMHDEIDTMFDYYAEGVIDSHDGDLLMTGGDGAAPGSQARQSKYDEARSKYFDADGQFEFGQSTAEDIYAYANTIEVQFRTAYYNWQE